MKKKKMHAIEKIHNFCMVTVFNNGYLFSGNSHRFQGQFPCFCEGAASEDSRPCFPGMTTPGVVDRCSQSSLSSKMLQCISHSFDQFDSCIFIQRTGVILVIKSPFR